MKYLTLILAMFLTACNGSSDDDSLLATKAQLPPNESTQVAALQTEVAALQSQMHTLQLIGKVHGVTTDAVGRMVDAIGNPVNFGPCADMGVMVGFINNSNTPTPDPLTANFQAFKQCTGYYYETEVATGIIGTAERLFWDGPNCTGNMIEWQAGGAGYNTQTLENGVVFLSPVDGTPLKVTAGQTAQPIQIQSAWVLSNPGCQSDIEVQLMYQVTPNDVSITGVPDNVGPYQLTSP